MSAQYSILEGLELLELEVRLGTSLFSLALTTQSKTVSSELSELSGQSAQQSGQLKEISAINGDQAVSLRSVQVGQAVANLNLSDINQGNQGDRQRRLLESQADTMLLTFSNGFRLSGQR